MIKSVFSLILLLLSGLTFASNCKTPGQYDSFILALSWTPGFCSTHPGNAVCENIEKQDPHLAYANQTFTLHGLWPNKSSCGRTYGNCSGFHDASQGFCSLPKIGLNPQVMNKLKGVMPGAYAGSCLQRHEWWKHGTCVFPDNPNRYFSDSISLVKTINDSAFVTQFIHKNTGKTVTLSAFKQAFDNTFGKNASLHMSLLCSHHNLGEIRIGLPANLPTKLPISSGDVKTLSTLIANSAVSKDPGNCGTHFTILSRNSKTDVTIHSKSPAPQDKITIHHRNIR